MFFQKTLFSEQTDFENCEHLHKQKKNPILNNIRKDIWTNANSIIELKI